MRDAKREVHELLQAAAQEIPAFDGSLLVKWHAVCEYALPDGSHSLVSLSSDASGRDLFKWESTGLLRTALEQQR